MSVSPDERQLILQAQSRLDGWTKRARTEAYDDLFGGEDAELSAGEIQRLDALDSELERRGGDGLWGTDRYGVHGDGRSDPSLGVVCVYHPQITSDSVLRGDDGLDDETEERLNAALWAYSERVANLLGERLDEFVRERGR